MRTFTERKEKIATLNVILAVGELEETK